MDQAEFEQNVHLMGYTPALLEQVQVACREVEAGLANQTYPFDYARQVALYHQIKTDLQVGYGT